MPRNFPPPYSVTDIGTAWEVRDANQYALTWFHYAEPGRSPHMAERMTREQAYAFAVQFARLPELLKKPGP